MTSSLWGGFESLHREHTVSTKEQAVLFVFLNTEGMSSITDHLKQGYRVVSTAGSGAMSATGGTEHCFCVVMERSRPEAKATVSFSQDTVRRSRLDEVTEAVCLEARQYKNDSYASGWVAATDKIRDSFGFQRVKITPLTPAETESKVES